MTETDQTHTAEVRNLLPSLAYCSKKLGAGQHDTRIDDNVPLHDGELGFDRLLESARKFGIRTQLVKKPLTLASPLAPPLIAITSEGEAIVIESLDFKKDVARVVFFSGEVATERSTSLRELSRNLRRVLLYVAKVDNAANRLDSSDVKRSAKDHWFWSAAGRFKGSYLQVILASLLVNTLALASPLFVMNVYDRVIPNLTIPTLWALAAGVVIALGFDFILKTLRTQIVDETGRRIDMAVSGRVFDHLLEARSDARPGSTGVLASYIRDFDNVRDVLTSSTVIAMTDAVFIVVFLLVLYWIVGTLVLVPIAAAVIVLLVTLWVQIPMNRAMKTAQSDSARRHGILIETLLNIDTVKRTGAAAHIRDRFDHSVAEASKTATATRFWSNFNTTIVQSASQAVSVILIVWGVFLVIEGQISVGALIAANILSGRVLAPLASIAGTLGRVQQAKHSYRSVSRLMDLPSEWSDAAPTRPLNQPNLSFEGVSYTYPEQKSAALKEISFSIDSGSRLAIIGRIGSGKSTIGALLSGLAQPTTGRILVDGVDIQQIPPVELRRFIGVVPQEPQLVSGTLHDNLTIGEPMASKDDIDYAIRMAGLEDLARDHPMGLSLPIAERGLNLSGGQRQAVALAQILIRRPRVLFLDEPTAALDRGAEQQLSANLRELSEREAITLVFATHRQSTLELADRLLVIDGGELLAFGPKEQVLNALKDRSQMNSVMAKAAQAVGAVP